MAQFSVQASSMLLSAQLEGLPPTRRQLHKGEGKGEELSLEESNKLNLSHREKNGNNTRAASSGQARGETGLLSGCVKGKHKRRQLA